jgi:two-component system sensor histidine kinase PhoQ
MTLNQRITISAGAVLLVFISLITLALNSAFVESSETALRKQLTSQLFALMAAAEVDDDGVVMPTDELDSLLGLPSSGLYAYVTDSDSRVLWRSSSILDTLPPDPITLAVGDKRFYTVSDKDSSYLIHAYGVNWAYESGGSDRSIQLTFNIITDLQDFNQQVTGYRHTLWRWLLAMSLILIITQASILRWGLSPLRQVSKELVAIESGRQDQIEQQYPLEIRRFTDIINRLISQERKQKLRYRNSLGDLAHSLKTPLAIIQTHIDRSAGKDTDSIQQQLEQINNIVEYQLQRAATAGRGDTGRSIVLTALIKRIAESLTKVYRDKGLSINIDIEDSRKIIADEGDMMELFGNLIDNACKWASSRVDIHYSEHGGRHHITVSDDGPGIDDDKAGVLLQRGTRADEAVAGHGIGLSIVRDIIDAYAGDLEIARSPSGGAQITVTLQA